VRRVLCRHFGDEREGLEALPFPGPLGQEIYEHVSKEAWEAWLRRQTMLINEYRLVVTDPKARRLLEAEMKAFLFGGGGDTGTSSSENGVATVR
jgi:Fe-S cluster biosynthesis and repair protein YggX